MDKQILQALSMISQQQDLTLQIHINFSVKLQINLRLLVLVEN